jgi:hypothetical protein
MHCTEKCWTNNSSAVYLVAIFFCTPTLARAIEFCDSIAYGIIGEAGFETGNNSTINGETIQCPGGGNDCDANTPTPTGQLDTIDVDFPPLDPPSFPATGGINLTDGQNLQPGAYGTLTAENQGSLTFAGGDDYFISEIDLSKNGTFATFGPGRYYINNFEMANGTSIRTTGKVEIFVGDELDGGNQLEFNVDGPTTDLIINLYQEAEFEVGNANQGNSDINFNGILYTPYQDTEIRFGNNNNITGAILSAGTVNAGNNTDFQFSEELAADIGETLGCEPANELNHVRLIHDGQTSDCGPQSLSLLACADEQCNERYDGGTSGTVLAGANALNWGLAEGETSLALSLYIPFDGTQDPDVQTTGLSISEPAVPLICEQTLSGSVNSSSACDVAVSRGGFVFDVDDFVSATPQDNILIQATRMDTGNECVPLFQDVERSLSLTSRYIDPGPGTETGNLLLDNAQLPSSIDLIFNANGQANLGSLDYRDAGEMQLGVSYEGSTTTGDDGTVIIGSDTFVVRPAEFEFTEIECIDGTGLNVSSGEPGNLAAFCRAGEAFSFAIRAVNALGVVTPNYGREDAPASALLDHSLEQPGTGGEPGTLTYGEPLIFNTSDGSPAGVAKVTDVTWNEVGIITLEARKTEYLDRPGTVVEKVSPPVGRFIPAYFEDISVNYALLPFCGTTPGFTYQGQPMAFDVSPQIELQAVDISGNALQNYFGTFFQYTEPANPDPANDDVVYALESGVAPNNVTVEPEAGEAWTLSEHDTSYVSHTLTFATNQLRFTRPEAQNTPFTSPVTMTLAAEQFVDEDGVCIRSNASTPDCEPVVFQDMAAPRQRYGRLMAENISGPVDVDLAIRISAQYWSDNGWTLNTEDNCTNITNAFIILEDESNLGPQSTGTGGNLVVGELPEGLLEWAAPGQQGIFRFRYNNADTWLQFNWNSDGNQTGPEALATFGESNRGNDRVISWDEI